MLKYPEIYRDLEFEPKKQISNPAFPTNQPFMGIGAGLHHKQQKQVEEEDEDEDDWDDFQRYRDNRAKLNNSRYCLYLR